STSFIGFRRQGIHRWLFVAWRTKRCSCSLWSSQGARRHFSAVAPWQRKRNSSGPHRPKAGGDRCDRLESLPYPGTYDHHQAVRERIASDQLGVLGESNSDELDLPTVDSLERR